MSVLISAAAVACFVVFAGLAGAGPVTRGQIGADTSCMVGADFVALETGVSGGASYTVPPGGRWAITSWTAQGGNGGQEGLVVFRPMGTADEYKVVGSTTPRTLSAAQNTFKADVKVKEGDLIGFWVQDSTVCARATGSPADTLGLFAPTGVPAAGTTLSVSPLTGYRLNLSVTLRALPDR